MSLAAAGRSGEGCPKPGQAKISHLPHHPLPATCHPAAGVQEEEGDQSHHPLPGASSQRKHLCMM